MEKAPFDSAEHERERDQGKPWLEPEPMLAFNLRNRFRGFDRQLLRRFDTRFGLTVEIRCEKRDFRARHIRSIKSNARDRNECAFGGEIESLRTRPLNGGEGTVSMIHFSNFSIRKN